MNPEALDKLGTRVASRLEALWDAYENGNLDRDELEAAALAILRVAEDQAAGLADLALAAWLSAAGRTAVAATGVRPRGNDHREALSAALAVGHDVRGRMGRLGRDVALQAAQDGYVDACRVRAVPGWERVPSAGACKMCQDLSGTVLPVTVDPFHHTGCSCGIRPVTEEETV